jgi:hypothetical protein
VVALSTVLGFTVIDHWLLVGPRLAPPDIWRFGLQLPLVAARLLLAAFYFYFMLGLSFNAALRSNLLLIAVYACAAVAGAIAAPVATYSRGRDGWSCRAPEDEAARAALEARQTADAPPVLVAPPALDEQQAAELLKAAT